VTISLRRAAGTLLVVALAVVLAACGGGFSAAPPPPVDPGLHHYVALGDGFTAAPYTDATVGDDGCLRSSANYPVLVAAELGITDVRDVSCTGVATSALSKATEPTKGKPAVPAQLDAVGKDTDLVTIGIGIEDGGLLRKMFAVCLAQPCAPGSTNAQAVLDIVNQTESAVTDALRQIQAKAPNAYIVVVGYPLLTPPPDGACDAYPTQPTLPDGTDPVTYLLKDLNTKLESTARQTGSGYVDVAALAADHALCSTEPWVHGMTGKPGKAVAYHPLAAEQRAIAQQLASQVKER
jgi:hypothetical protein